jgi:hypothetical protein
MCGVDAKPRAASGEHGNMAMMLLNVENVPSRAGIERRLL